MQKIFALIFNIKETNDQDMKGSITYKFSSFYLCRKLRKSLTTPSASGTEKRTPSATLTSIFSKIRACNLGYSLILMHTTCRLVVVIMRIRIMITIWSYFPKLY